MAMSGQLAATGAVGVVCVDELARASPPCWLMVAKSRLEVIRLADVGAGATLLAGALQQAGK